MTSPPAPHLRGFHALAGGLALSTLADGLVFVILPLWVYAQTGSAVQTGLTFAVQAVPRVVLAPLAGVVGDRLDRRGILLVTYLTRLVLFAALYGVLSQKWLGALYAVLFLEAAAGVFARPAANALVTQLVPPAGLAAANGTLNTLFSLAQVVSPALGAVLVTQLGAPLALGAALAVLVAACTTLLLLPRLPLPARAAASIWNDFGVGWSFAVGTPAVAAVAASNAFLWLGQGIVVAAAIPWLAGLPQVGAGAFGWVITGTGAGMVLGGLAGSTLLSRTAPPRLYSVTLACCAAALGLTVVPASLPWLLTAFVLFGFFTMLSITSGQTLLQLGTPPPLMGRVFSFSFLAGEGCRLLGLLAAPLIIQAYGGLTAMLVAAAVTLLGVGVFGALRRQRAADAKLTP